NIGNFSRDRFAVLPELGLNIGYHITPHCRIFVGYNFLYLSNVLRPADQIDTGLDVTRIPFFTQASGSNVGNITNAQRLSNVRPVVPFRESDFFAQGVNVGLQFTW
ncbi:MAG: BBP7 family outer membrane beta-barrel protein, partial [Gemmataceae bacterium]